MVLDFNKLLIVNKIVFIGGLAYSTEDVSYNVIRQITIYKKVQLPWFLFI
jgi:hypothetical protein